MDAEVRHWNLTWHKIIGIYFRTQHFNSNYFACKEYNKFKIQVTFHAAGKPAFSKR